MVFARNLKLSFSFFCSYPATCSETGTRKVCIQNLQTKENSTNQRIRIYNPKGQVISVEFNVDSFDHGAIVCHPRLSNIVFSPDEQMIAYVAEQKIAGGSFFKGPEDRRLKLGTKFEFEFSEGWGEQLEPSNHTCICVLTLRKGCKPVIIELPDRTLVRPFWIDDQTIGFVGYKEPPKRLRLFSCYNRVNFFLILKVRPHSKKRFFKNHSKTFTPASF